MCILLAVGVVAQSHSFRDTSYVKYEQFDFIGYISDTSYPLHGYQTSPPSIPGDNNQASLLKDDIVQYNYTASPDGMRVVGISAVIQTNYRTPVCPMVPPEYLLLYDAMPDTFQLKAMVQWEVCDTVGRPYYDWIVNAEGGKPITWSQAFQAPIPEDLTIFDMYFSEPVTVYDSFYVGGTQRMGMGNTNWDATYFCYNLMTLDTITNTVSRSYRPILWKVYSYDSVGRPWAPNQWHGIQTNQWMMVLPIIEVVDTSFANAPECPRVSGLFVRGSYTDTVTLQWSPDSLHTEFELSYGREGIRPEEGTIITLHDTTKWQFTDTAYSDTPMVAYVRTVCREYDTLRWSNWGSPAYWRLHHERPADTTQTEGITVPDDGSDLSRFVRLMPNPASRNVVVMSSYGINGLEVYDVRGERVMEQKGTGRGTTAVFDVTGWAKGAYVVLVHTPAGTTAKRLVVKGN